MSKKGPSAEEITRERLIELYSNTEASMEEIGNLFGVHHQTIARWLKYFNIPSKGRSRPGTTKRNTAPILANREWMKAQLDAGKMMKDIAAELGVKANAVSYWAKRHGLSNETKSESIKKALAKKYPGGRRGELASNWRGGRMRTNAGYIMVNAPDHPYARNGRVFEHRLVMEHYLGRYLEPDEIVHHKDGNKQNNTIENLELIHNGEHISAHFHASHEVIALRKRVAELEAEIAALRKRLGESDG